MVRNGPCWSSQLLRTEALRAAERLGVDGEAVIVTEALDVVSLVTPGDLPDVDHQAWAGPTGDDAGE